MDGVVGALFVLGRLEFREDQVQRARKNEEEEETLSNNIGATWGGHFGPTSEETEGKARRRINNRLAEFSTYVVNPNLLEEIKVLPIYLAGARVIACWAGKSLWSMGHGGGRGRCRLFLIYRPWLDV